MSNVSQLYRAGRLGLLAVALVAPNMSLVGGPRGNTTLAFSILAYDRLTGEFGAAAASEAPLIGMNLDLFDLSAGGTLVHGGPHIDVGSTILRAMRDGREPDRAIALGLAIDDERDERQVLAVSSLGASAFTGKKLDKVSAQKLAVDFVAAGQALPSAQVVEAMAETFEASDGPLGDRLLSALIAANRAADHGPLAHSAALLVVSPRARFATRNRLVDLRIDFVPGDAVAALSELRMRVDSVYGVN